VTFHVADARHALPFDDASVDLVHVRLLVGFLTRSTWPDFLHECWRVLKPGGVLCSVEMELLFVNCPELHRAASLIIQAMYQAGHAWMPDGPLTGIFAAQEPLLRHAGFIERRQEVLSLPFSTGTSAHSVLTNTLLETQRLLQPFLLQAQVASREQLQESMEQCRQEIATPDCWALALYQRVWGRKPALLSFP
jgi:SAM-dependent methyltransferase